MPTKPAPSKPSALPDLGAIEIAAPICAVFRRHLRSLGQKYTPERAQILSVLMEMDSLFQADELLSRMKATGFRVSKATIYRTIKLLQDAGIIQQVLVDSEQAHYHLAYGSKPCDLLIDVETNRVIAIDIPEMMALRDRICREHGMEAKGHRVQIFASRRA
jgi:Fur family transcriptional regulator, ferric uptake regulator